MLVLHDHAWAHLRPGHVIIMAVSRPLLKRLLLLWCIVASAGGMPKFSAMQAAGWLLGSRGYGPCRCSVRKVALIGKMPCFATVEAPAPGMV
jgi:hypothetical protein